MLVGRRGEADIQLRFDNVSTRHCRLTLEYGYWFVRDLNSRNGIKVDGRTVERKRLDPNAKLSIARHEYVVEFDPKSLGAYGPPPADDEFMDVLMRSSLMDRAGFAQREIGGCYGQLIPHDGTDPIGLHKPEILIGRGREADVQLDFDDVSHSHCRLNFENCKWFIHDLNSEYGTKVNGRLVARNHVDPWDELSIAEHTYVLEYYPPQAGECADAPPPHDDDEIDAMIRDSPRGSVSRPRHRR